MKKLGLFLVIGVFLTLAWAQTPVFEDDFQSYPDGSLPHDVYYNGPLYNCKVVEEGTNKWFMCSMALGNFRLTLLEAFSGEPYWIVEQRMKHRDGVVNIGITFCDVKWVGNPSNQLAAIWADSSGNVVVHGILDETGVHTTEVIGQHSLSLGSWAWYDVRAIVSQTKVELFINGTFVGEYEFSEEFYGDYFRGPFHLVWSAWGGAKGIDDIVVSSYLPGIVATLDIAPDTIKMKSKGKWITAYIELPEGYDVMNVLVDTILLNDTVEARQVPVTIGDHDDDGTLDLMVKFKRVEVIGTLSPGEEVEITITGEMEDGIVFSTSDTVKVLN